MDCCSRLAISTHSTRWPVLCIPYNCAPRHLWFRSMDRHSLPVHRRPHLPRNPFHSRPKQNKAIPPKKMVVQGLVVDDEMMEGRRARRLSWRKFALRCLRQQCSSSLTRATTKVRGHNRNRQSRKLTRIRLAASLDEEDFSSRMSEALSAVHRASTLVALSPSKTSTTPSSLATPSTSTASSSSRSSEEEALRAEAKLLRAVERLRRVSIKVLESSSSSLQSSSISRSASPARSDPARRAVIQLLQGIVTFLERASQLVRMPSQFFYSHALFSLGKLIP